ncbi:DUF1211 domain-containing protein [Candidatus Saccharibacteria bacterium]|nr:DUF1211 domain-containing protein [Candidatus Saccharibacteria bacterium]
MSKALLAENDKQTFSTRRLEALTDGVFAIAMTLLVLDLKVPEIVGQVTNTGLMQALRGMQSNVVSFVVSFLLLGSMWAVHVRQFEHFHVADRHFTMINTLRLLAVVFIPFTTSLAGAYPNLLIARVLFPLNFFFLALISWWQWSYATKLDKQLKANLDKPEIVNGEQRNVVFLLISAATVVLSIFVGTWAFLLFALAPVFMRLFTAPVKVD